MKCTIETTFPKPCLEIINNEVFCLDCYGLYQKDKKIYENKNNKSTNLKSKIDSNDRLKYLRKNFNYLHNNIILFLNEAIEKKIFNNLKRISNDRYINALYKFYCQKSNINYKPLVDKKLLN